MRRIEGMNLLSVFRDRKNVINFIARSTTCVTQIRRMDESKIRSGGFPSDRNIHLKEKRKKEKIPSILIRIYSPPFLPQTRI